MTDLALAKRLCAAFWGDRDGGEGRWKLQDSDTQHAWGLVAREVDAMLFDERSARSDEPQTPYQHQQLAGGMIPVQATNATVLVAADGSYAVHVSKRDGKVKRVDLLQGSTPAR